MARVGSSRLPLDFGEPSDDRLRRLGELLRSTRLARNEELSHAAAWLKIRPAYLAALEEGDLAAMPGPAYATGFLRSYADHLGLDGADLAASAQDRDCSWLRPPRHLYGRHPTASTA